MTVIGAFVSILPPALIGQIVDSLNQPDINLIIRLGVGAVALTVVQAHVPGAAAAT